MGASHPPPSVVETVAGNLATEALLTLVGTLSGHPVAALLPVLSNSIAGSRQRNRVERTLREIEHTLSERVAALEHLSDAQYKLLNETILALLHTTSPEKLRYLRLAVTNCLIDSELVPQDAVALSRIIRDISAEEAAFLIGNFQYDRVQIWPLDKDDDPSKVLAIRPNSELAAVASGLMSMGLLIGAGPIMNDLGRYTYSPLVAKLIALLRE